MVHFQGGYTKQNHRLSRRLLLLSMVMTIIFGLMIFFLKPSSWLWILKAMLVLNIIFLIGFLVRELIIARLVKFDCQVDDQQLIIKVANKQDRIFNHQDVKYFILKSRSGVNQCIVIKDGKRSFVLYERNFETDDFNQLCELLENKN